MRVERTDFATVLRERALQFYGETLGLRRNAKAHHDWPEFETGNLTLQIVHYEQIGRDEFTPNTAPIALRVADVEETRRELEVCHLAVFSDPDGNAFMLHRRYAPYDDGSIP